MLTCTSRPPADAKAVSNAHLLAVNGLHFEVGWIGCAVRRLSGRDRGRQPGVTPRHMEEAHKESTVQHGAHHREKHDHGAVDPMPGRIWPMARFTSTISSSPSPRSTRTTPKHIGVVARPIGRNCGTPTAGCEGKSRPFHWPAPGHHLMTLSVISVRLTGLSFWLRWVGTLKTNHPPRPSLP